MGRASSLDTPPWDLHSHLSLIESLADFDNCVLFATIQLPSHQFRIANIYTPTDLSDCSPFFDHLASDSLRFMTLDALLGDWNAYSDVTVDHISDRSANFNPATWPRLTS